MEVPLFNILDTDEPLNLRLRNSALKKLGTPLQTYTANVLS